MGHGDQITSTGQTQNLVSIKLADSRFIRLGNLAENTTYLNSYDGKLLVGSVRQTFIRHSTHCR